MKAPAVDVGGELHCFMGADCNAEATSLADLFIGGDADAGFCLGHNGWFFAMLPFPAPSLPLPGISEKTVQGEDRHVR